MVYYNNPDFSKEAYSIGKEYKSRVNKAVTRRKRIDLALKYYDKFIQSADSHGIKLECHQDPEENYVSYVNYLIKKNNYKTVLDYGCAEGKFLQSLYKINRKPNYFGIDFDIYNKKPRGFKYLTYKKDNFIPDPFTFDLITSHHVVEHIHSKDIQSHFNNVYDHLNPGGIYFFSLPSKLCGDFWDTSVIDNFHIGQYSYSDFSREFEKTKFNNLKRVFFNIKYFPKVINPLVDLDFLNQLENFHNKYLFAACNLFTLRIVAFKD
jgi:SAM-dependent methyltransferase